MMSVDPIFNLFFQSLLIEISNLLAFIAITDKLIFKL